MSNTFRLGNAKKVPSQLNVFPNPSSGEITISLNQGNIKNLTLYNLLGEKVSDLSLNEQEFKWTPTVTQTGIYIIEVLTEGGKQLKRKIILHRE